MDCWDFWRRTSCGLAGPALSGAVIAKDLLKSHLIGLTETFLTTNSSVGGETPAQFINAGQGFTPSSQLTSPTYGSLSLNNGSGDSFNLQTSSSGPMTESLSLGSDGVITPASNVAALNFAAQRGRYRHNQRKCLSAAG